MNTSHERKIEPIAYRMRVAGHLDLHWSDWFDGVAIEHEPNGTTLLAGLLADQSAVYGLLGKARHLNLTLLSLCLRSDAPRSSL